MKKIKTSMKIGILFLGFCITLFSCQKNDEFVTTNNPIIQKKYTAKKITLQEIKKNVRLTEFIKNIEQRFDYCKSSKQNKSISTTDNSFTILTDEIIQVSTDSSETYTFRIENPTNPDSDFENFIIEKLNNNEYAFFVYRFKKTEINHGYDFSKQRVSNSQINLGDFKDIIAARVDYFASIDCWVDITYDAECQCTVITVLTCGGGGASNGSGTGDGSTSGGNNTSGNDGTTTGDSTGGETWDTTGENTTGGGASSSSGDGTSSSGSDGTSPVGILPSPEAKMLDTFFENLTTEQEECLDFQLHSEIKTFLLDNFDESKTLLDENFNNAQNFAKLVLDNCGSNVDWDDRVIISPTFSDNTCLNSVFTSLGKTSTFNNYLKKFDAEFSVAHLKLSSSSSLPSNTNAQTTEPINYIIEITFNTNNLDRPSLDIARTMIHELIHAEIFRKLLSLAKRGRIPWSESFIRSIENDYPGLYDYYLRYEYNVPVGSNLSSAQHEAMAQHYRNIIEQTLKEYDNTQSPEIYNALAWSGLKETVAWSNLSQEEKDDIAFYREYFFNSNPNCQ